MGLFVTLEVDEVRCNSEPECRECVQVCPVDVFQRNEGVAALSILDNEDECILCDQCVERCPSQAVTLLKHY